MNRFFYILIFLLVCNICNSQNLVPNRSFEDYTMCPYNDSQLDFAFPWINPSSPSYGTPDFYNSCDSVGSMNVPNTLIGFQAAHSGDGYSGIYLAYNGSTREYIEVPLMGTLTPGSCYHFEMYVNLANACQYTTDDIAVYFTNTVITNVTSNILPYTPQLNNAAGNTFDSLGWTLVSGNYIANGGEDNLIIGNFKDDVNTTGILLYPGATNTYIYCYIDDVCLTPCGSPCNTTGIEEQNKGDVTTFPNPFNDDLTFRTTDNKLYEIILYDNSSRKILQQEFTNAVTLQTEQLAKGIYIYEVRNKSGVIKNGKVVKD